ncbi:hypothetical protein [Leifsonia poae]|uniref:hypothetical protein n=1 Tax=Leifsonia poae TaxID=110933 RepID=UPI003D677BD8
MHLFILWVGFVGAWLLFAGPLYQAAIELQDEQLDRERFDAAMHDVGEPERVSNWWWLLPPVAYWKQRKVQTEYRMRVFEALGSEELHKTVRFLDKAKGWMIVAGGAFFIGVKETWELVEASEWPIWVFWVLVVLMPLIGIIYTVANVSRSNGVVKKAEEREAERAQSAPDDSGSAADPSA